MVMRTSRQRVLDYVKRQGSVSAPQVGRSLNMSAANARHHLSILLADESIQEIGQARRQRRGRPVKLYGLSEKLLGDNLALLLDALLTESLNSLVVAQRDAAIKALANTLWDRIGRAPSNVPMAKRLAHLVEKLNELHYQARWEAGAGGPRLLFGHCPYAAIIEQHPELCQMDAGILSSQLKMPSNQLAKIDKFDVRNCVFQMRGST